MTTRECQKFLSDPENHAEHVNSCAHCAALMRGLDIGEAAPEPIADRFTPERLPLAEWEGATHRNWAAVVLAGLAIIAAAAMGFMASGVSPFEGVSRAIEASVVPASMPLRLIQHFGKSLQRAPMVFHMAVLSAFVAVNLLLVLLLKRSPKGLDAPTE